MNVKSNLCEYGIHIKVLPDADGLFIPYEELRACLLKIKISGIFHITDSFIELLYL
jgi:hypothetical protein